MVMVCAVVLFLMSIVLRLIGARLDVARRERDDWHRLFDETFREKERISDDNSQLRAAVAMWRQKWKDGAFELENSALSAPWCD